MAYITSNVYAQKGEVRGLEDIQKNQGKKVVFE